MARQSELGLLGLARRAGHVVVGAKAVKAAARRGRVAAIVIAGDATDNAIARLGSVAEEVPTVSVGTREALGRAVGRERAAVVGITDRQLARRILADKAEKEAPEDGCDDDTGAHESPRRQAL